MRKNSEEPTPYEVDRDILQIGTSILLTSSIIFLMIFPFIQDELYQKFIIFCLCLVIIFVLWDLVRFHKKWVKRNKRMDFKLFDKIIIMKKQSKRVLGRWFEGLGIGIVSGTIITFPITGLMYWYFFIIGAIILFIGTHLYENNSKEI